MKIYTDVEAVPSRLLGAARLLEAHRNGLEYDKLLELLQPLSIRSKEDADTMSRNTVAAGLEMGLLEESQEEGVRRVRFGALARSSKTGKRSLAERLPRLAANLCLRPEIDGKPNKFAAICAWLLLQPSGEMPQGHDEFKEKMKSQGLDLEDYSLSANLRWDNVLYWTNYLGLTWQREDAKCRGVVADPTTLLLRYLQEIFPKAGARMRVQQFLATLGSLCPVLDGGVVHGEMARRLTLADAIRTDRTRLLSDSLSLALRTLKAAGHIQYDCPNDEADFWLLSRNEKIAYLQRRNRRTDS